MELHLPKILLSKSPSLREYDEIRTKVQNLTERHKDPRYKDSLSSRRELYNKTNEDLNARNLSLISL
jgi:hypothetical protein